MSINQQGLVIFSMIRDDTTISLAPRSPSNSVVRSERTLTEPGAAVDSATVTQEHYLMPDFNSQTV